MRGLSSARIVRPLAVLPALAALLLLSGCDEESYPSSLRYPLRSDPLVTKAPSDQPPEPPTPGQLEQSIAKIPSLQGEIRDPKALAEVIAQEKKEEKIRELEGQGTSRDAAKSQAEAMLPQFRAQAQGPANQIKNDLRQALDDKFGTPAAPRVGTDKEEDSVKQAVARLKLEPNTLARGSVLYRRHCLHCHGLTGDGRGPTGPWLNPFPRDYRQGKFKFISTDNKIGEQLNARKPRREDLLRTLRQGIDGTSMPSFNVQANQDLEDLVSYVIHLSVRGEVEFDTLRNVMDNKGATSGLEGESVKDHVENRLGVILGQWAGANKSNEPPDYPYGDNDDTPEFKASVRRGYALFTDTKGSASCIGCHYDFGRQVPFRYDDWGTLVRPANLTAGVYRGGRRPIDLYWRIKGGIPPSGMPAADFKKTSDYWDLVNFVRALPYPAMLPDDVKEGVYGPARKAPPSDKPVRGHD